MSRPKLRPKSRPNSRSKSAATSAPKHVFQLLCDEAARACPDGGMAEVERYVANRLAAMDEDSRLAVTREMQQVLGFHAPDCPTFKQ